MIRDEDAALTGCVYLDLNTRDYGGFVDKATTIETWSSAARACDSDETW